MAKRRGLAQNRGLTALMGEVESVERSVQQPATSSLPVTALQRGVYQPRDEITEDALKELADSVREHGVVQPIVVRRLTEAQGSVTHEIVAGERRWRAAMLAGLQEVPVHEKQLSDQATMALALIENIQREDLTPLEEARGLERFYTEFGLSHAEIAKAVGKARTTVSNLLRLLQLAPEVQLMLSSGDLDMGHARALLSVPNQQQLSLAKKVVANQLSVRQTEELVKNFLNPTAKPAKSPDPDTQKLMQSLSETLGARVDIQQSKNGRGKMTIYYAEASELDQILSQMGLGN